MPSFRIKKKSEKKEGEEYLPFGPEFWADALGRGVALGFAKGENEDLQKAFSAAIYDATEDGTISRLSRKWMDYDGAVHQAVLAVGQLSKSDNREVGRALDPITGP